VTPLPRRYINRSRAYDRGGRKAAARMGQRAVARSLVKTSAGGAEASPGHGPSRRANHVGSLSSERAGIEDATTRFVQGEVVGGEAVHLV
jgi:hypothetical protein